MNLHLGIGAQLRSASCIAAAVCALALTGVSASASSITFTGEDLTAGPGALHPLSSAAAASFTSAASLLGTVSTINFESAPVGNFSSLVIAPGVTISGLGSNLSSSVPQSINNNYDHAFPSLDGFNTTPGGANFVQVNGGTITFTFATPTDFFGAYFSGVQTYFYPDNLTFSDGTSETISIPGAGTNGSTGALDYVGFTDAGKSITSITLTASNVAIGADYIGIDDVSYDSGPVSTATPEPSSLLLLGTGLAGLAGLTAKRFSHS